MFPSICTNVLLADTKKSHWCFRPPMNQNNSPVMQYCALMSVLICDIQLFPFIERGPAGSLGCFLSMIYTHTQIYANKTGQKINLSLLFVQSV